jgi:hypothetical protein
MRDAFVTTSDAKAPRRPPPVGRRRRSRSRYRAGLGPPTPAGVEAPTRIAWGTSAALARAVDLLGAEAPWLRPNGRWVRCRERSGTATQQDVPVWTEPGPTSPSGPGSVVPRLSQKVQGQTFLGPHLHRMFGPRSLKPLPPRVDCDLLARTRRAGAALPTPNFSSVLMLPDFERADRIGEFWDYPQQPTDSGDSRSSARRNAMWPCARPSSRRSGRRRCACG